MVGRHGTGDRRQPDGGRDHGGPGNSPREVRDRPTPSLHRGNDEPDRCAARGGTCDRVGTCDDHNTRYGQWDTPGHGRRGCSRSVGGAYGDTNRKCRAHHAGARARSDPCLGTDADADDPATATTSVTSAGHRDDGRVARRMSPNASVCVLGTVRAMASDVQIHGVLDAEVGDVAVQDALGVFPDFDRTCTRFSRESPLIRVNEQPDRWHRVPLTLFRAVREAHRAYQGSRGRFDPRILTDLVGLGYDRSLPFEGRAVLTSGTQERHWQPQPWRPRFRGGQSPELHLGGQPIDLGGIGKGLALRWAAQQLDAGVQEYLIDAGGDCVCRGRGPDGDGWRIGVEDPSGGEGPLAVVEVRDRACATSSIRLRRWRCRGKTVHHLLDPTTGRPGGAGLLAVTAIHPDPATAEVLTKVLFLEGRRGISAEAARRRVPAYWVGTDERTDETSEFSKYVIWRRR